MCRGDRESGGKYHKGDSQGGLVRTVQKGFEDSIEHSPVLNQVVVSSGKPILVELELDGCSLTMELDTAVLLVFEKTYRLLFPDIPIQESTARQKARLPLVVVAGEGPSLFGRDWLQAICLDWKGICQVERCQLSDILSRYKKVFQPRVGTHEGMKSRSLWVRKHSHAFIRPTRSHTQCKEKWRTSLSDCNKRTLSSQYNSQSGPHLLFQFGRVMGKL